MNQSHPTRPTMKSEILAILNDGRWHGCSSFIHIGTSYSQRISELREEGYGIESIRENNRPTYRYRLSFCEEKFEKPVTKFIEQPPFFRKALPDQVSKEIQDQLFN